MRRVLVAAAAIAVIGGVAAPAMAKPDVPVSVYGEPNGGICVAAFHWVPQCVDTGQIGATH